MTRDLQPIVPGSAAARTVFDPDRAPHPLTVLGEWLEPGKGVPHRHRRHQLLYADAGVVTVLTADGRWVCPPERAVWVPGGTEHAVQAARPFRLCTLYAEPYALADEAPAGCAVVGVPAVAREILRAALALSPSAGSEHPVRRALALVPALVQPLAGLSPGLPLPTDRRARGVAERWLLRPDDPDPLASVARDAGASLRTLERCFLAETGLGLAQWRTRLRLAVALERLGAGISVTEAAHAVGYDSVAAFSRAFRQAHGFAPSRVARRAAASASA